MRSGDKNPGMVFEFELDAANGMPMPDGLTMADQLAYLAFRQLYSQYKQKIIDINLARNEKNKILKSYEIWKLREKYHEKSMRIWSSIAVDLCEFEKNPTIENARKIIERIYNIRGGD